MRPHSLVAGSFALLLSACAALPQPTAADVERAQKTVPGVTLDDLSRDRKTYVKICSGCHALHVPAEFPSQRWPSLVQEMVTVQKVKLTTEQRQQIEEFLTAMAP